MRYILTGDLHFGHTRTPTIHIINSFKKTILIPINRDIDVLFIAGDIFDRLLDFNSESVHCCIDFFNYLLSYCTVNNIKLRVLEGTPSHDWQQSFSLVKLNNIRENKCDLRYFNVLDIEYLTEFNKHILYIPDEWCKDHKELEIQIKDKLKENNISNVDIAILHGHFKYQIRGFTAPFHYKEDYFLNLVKGFIHIGHYHSFSVFNRIIAQGSLERLSHNEEEDKGYVLVTDDSYEFKVNPYSYTYKTINITKGYTLEKLDKQIAKYPKESYIRLSVSNDHDFSINFDKLKLRYLDYTLKKLNKDALSESGNVTYILDDDTIEDIEHMITNSNIHDILLTSVINKNTFIDSQIEKVKNYLIIFKNIPEEQHA